MTEIGFIGLGHMGVPMVRRLIHEDHHVVIVGRHPEVVQSLTALGARAVASPKDLADQVETVMVCLPSQQASLDVATGAAGVIEGSRVKRYVELSTVGSKTAVQIHDLLAERNIAAIDSPVSGGVSGAEKGTLAVMVSGPHDEFELLQPLLQAIGRPFFVDARPGAAQTMKLINNLLSTTALVATAEAMVMGVKSGLDPGVMLDVLNAGSGATTASRDKFPRAILPRTFDYGFATGLMVKDVRLYLDEVKALGMTTEVADAVGRQWELALRDQGPDSDFTTVIKPIEQAAGVVVSEDVTPGGRRGVPPSPAGSRSPKLQN